MQLSIEHIEREMVGSALTPDQIADFRTHLAAVASMESAKLEEILVRKPATWLRFREQKNGDRAADREWEATNDGITEMKLRMLLRRIDRLNSALSARLRVMEIERRSQL